MEDDEDDFYGGGGVKQEQQIDTEGEEDEKMEVSEEEDDDDDDSDEDVTFQLEKPEGAKADPPPAKQQKTTHDRAVSDSKPTKGSTPTTVKAEPVRSGSTAPPTAVRGTLTHDGKEGKDFPEVRTSKLDVNGTPTWGNGKPITEVDIDADLAENSKPWRLPGTDITDFFNYGFDEYTWTQYCLRQQTLGNQIGDMKQQDAQMKAMFGSAPGGPMGGMDGMPPPEMMMQMMQGMQGMPGMPPDFMMSGLGGMPPMGGAQGGGFGSGQNSASPNPQPSQGFQPPQGPSGGANMEGFSTQQIAIMQQEQQGHGGGGGGGGGRGRNRRGRGGW